MAKRVLVCGGRNYADYHTVDEVLNGLHKSEGISHIIQGGAVGADRFARQWAIDNKVEMSEFLAHWNEFGHAAGPIRNEQMLRIGKPDLVIAFPGGPGTANMIKLARRAAIAVTEITE